MERDAFANAALTLCRNARASDSVRNSHFYRADIDTIAVLVDADPSAYGQGSDNQPTSAGAKAFFAMPDLTHSRAQETWGKAGLGEETFRLSQ